MTVPEACPRIVDASAMQPMPPTDFAVSVVTMSPFLDESALVARTAG
jgi:hypothetical protein